MNQRRRDMAYQNINFNHYQMDHCYGPNVHILTDPVSLGQLADLCLLETTQPVVNNLVRELYQFLIRSVVKWEFPIEEITIKTRMGNIDEKGYWTGLVIKKQTKVVTVNIMRAGALPSQVSFDFFNRILDPSFIRQDHVVMSRIVNEDEHVTGSMLQGSKIGGSIDNAMLVFPDPMGATGSSISAIIGHYKEHVIGKPTKIFALHLIITPEYIKKILNDHPEVIIYALRLDRGASSSHVLQQKPGLLWDLESGLNDKDYILPGAGGLGEIINNSYC